MADNAAKVREPTARQLATAADIANRFVRSRDLTPEEWTHVHNAAALMGLAAWRKAAEEADSADELEVTQRAIEGKTDGIY